MKNVQYFGLNLSHIMVNDYPEQITPQHQH